MLKRSICVLTGLVILACGSPERDLESKQVQTFSDVYSDYLKRASREKISPQQRDSLLSIVLLERQMNRQEFQEILEYLEAHPESLETVIDQTLEALSANSQQSPESLP
jgi:hypothetical protein